MAIYVYECKKCGHRTEKHRMIKHRHVCPKCAECGGKTERVIADRVSISRAKDLIPPDSYKHNR